MDCKVFAHIAGWRRSNDERHRPRVRRSFGAPVHRDAIGDRCKRDRHFVSVDRPGSSRRWRRRTGRRFEYRPAAEIRIRPSGAGSAGPHNDERCSCCPNPPARRSPDRGPRNRRRGERPAVVAAPAARFGPGAAGGRRLHGSGQLGDRHRGRLALRAGAAVGRAAVERRGDRCCRRWRCGSGIVARLDLARACRERYGPAAQSRCGCWPRSRSSRATSPRCSGSALALHLLFGVSLRGRHRRSPRSTRCWCWACKGKGFRQRRGDRAGLVVTIGVCFAIELALVGPDWHAVAAGFVPRVDALRDPHALLHRDRHPRRHRDAAQPVPAFVDRADAPTAHATTQPGATRCACRRSTPSCSLTLALLVNAAILVLAAGAFHAHGPQRRHRDPGRLPPARPARRLGRGGAAVRRRAAGVGPELDVHRHHRGPDRSWKASST